VFPEASTVLRLNYRRYRAAIESLAYLSDARSKVIFLRETLRLCKPWRKQPAAPAPGLLRLRVSALGGREICCRRTYADLGVFYDTFAGQYHLPPPWLEQLSTILDLGSNIGLTMAHYAVLYPEARILGVELDEENCRLAQKNVAQFGRRCQVLHAALWYEPGRVCYAGTRESGYSVTRTTASLDCRSVESVTLEALLDTFGIPEVDFVKMDIEGAEAEVLPRGQHWARRVRAMKVEVHPAKCSPPYPVAKCQQDLEGLGFRTTVDERHPSCVIAWR